MELGELENFIFGLATK